ncbi:MAG: hypothetical protein WAW73_11730 [Rhodoferax sp.]
MKNKAGIVRPWSTATFGDSADTSPIELESLGEHLSVCRSEHGKLLALHCAAESMGGFIVSRMVTSIVAVGFLVAMVRLAL